MNETRRLIKITGIYFFGTVGTKLVSFLLIPLYTAYLSPSQYGRYDLNITYATLFSSFCFLDIWTGIMKFMFEKNDEKNRRKVVYSGLFIFFSSSIIYAASITIFSRIKPMEYLPGVIGYGLFLCLQNLYGYLARAYGKNVLFAVTGIVSTLCNALGNLVLLTVFHWDYKALYVSYALGVLAQCLLLERKLRIISVFKREYLDKETIHALLRFSLPLCVNSLCYWLLTGYNRVVIEKHLNATVNGYYAVASKFGGILVLVSSCFSLAWQEIAYGRYERDRQAGKFYSHATNMYIKVLFCGFFVMVPVIYFLFPYLTDEAYGPAKALIPLNTLAVLASVLFTFLGNIISTYKRTDIVFLSTLAASVVNLVSLHYLVGKLGAEAANLSLLAGYVVSDGIRIFMISREIDYRIEWNRFLFFIPLTLMTLMGYWMGQGEDNLVLILVGAMISVWTLWPIVAPAVMRTWRGRKEQT